MFADAKTLKNDSTKAKKAKKEIAIGNLEKLAAVDAAMKALEGIKKTLESEVKGDISDHFVNMGVELKSRPENFKGIDGKGAASCELRIRSSRSSLSEDETTLLGGYGVTTETETDVPECFVINPKYSGDMRLLGLIEKKLSTIKDLPSDLILKQEGKTRTVVGEDAINQVFKLLDRDVIESLLPVVSVIALKPTFDGNPFTFVGEMLEEENETSFAP